MSLIAPAPARRPDAHPRPAPLTGWILLSAHPLLALVRRLLLRAVWRPALAVVGPLHLEGLHHLPPGPCVLVADHRSHVDAIAIRVALTRGGRHDVLAAAAEDHWFGSRRRGVVAVLAAGGFPLPRHGRLGLDRAAGLLAAGHDVILFPQGSRDASAARWRSGAGHLALSTGAPLVPVRTFGMDRVLPKGARWPRPHPMAIAFGAPMYPPIARPTTAPAAPLAADPTPPDPTPPDPMTANPLPAGHEAEEENGTRASDHAVALVARARTAADALDLPAPIEGRLVGLSVSLRRTAVRRGVLLLTVWAFAEATVWPLIPDLLLAGMCLAVPRLAPRLVAATTLGSAVGGAAALSLGRAGIGWPLWAVTAPMQTGAATAVASDGALAVLRQPLSGIPYKAFNAAAVHADVDVFAWVGGTVVARGARMAVVALVAATAGRLLWSGRLADGWAPRLHALAVLVGLGVFVLGWGLVVAAWA